MSIVSLRTNWRPCLLAALLFASPVAQAQEYAPGEKLTIIHCGRCHVVGEKNRMGGIGSTPSFAGMLNWDNWEEKMKAFWTYRPHPAFSQVAGVTPPFPPNRPSPIHPISLTLEELAKIIEYTRTLKPKDLGPDPWRN